MPVIEAETLESISDEPLAHANSIGLISNLVFVKRSAEVLRLLKN